MRLPVKPKDDRDIIDDDDAFVCFANTTKRRDKIIIAINSYEKSKDIIFEVARQAIGKYDINAPPLTKNRFANEFIDSFEQAFKELGEE